MKPEQIEIKCHVDDRGFLYQIYGSYSDKFPEVKRIYVVGNFSKGIITRNRDTPSFIVNVYGNDR